jgi:hypothetical protein
MIPPTRADGESEQEETMSERLKVQLTGILVVATVLGSVGYALAGGGRGPSSGKASQRALDAFAAASTASASGSDASAQGSGDPVGPDATGPAMFGLCTAWAATQSQGGINGQELGAVAFLNLWNAAAGDVTAYCEDATPGNGAANGHAATPNSGGSGTADTASGGASEAGTTTAATWSGGRSGLGAGNH